MQDLELEIIYQDEHYIAINKPHGLLVHKTNIASDAKEFALQTLRNQIGKHVFPVHRIDRKTSGVLLFALDSESAKQIRSEFDNGNIRKEYLAIVRGYFKDSIVLEHPLYNENGVLQDAITEFYNISSTELPIPFGQHQTSRYSLISAFPKTGRIHQIRKHLNHLRHPIVGDRPHGCNKQNRLFKEKWNMTKMMLHANKLTFTHPYTSNIIEISANTQTEFNRMMKTLNLDFQDQ